MARRYLSARVKLGAALGLASLASIVLYITGDWAQHQNAFAYMIWNLILAWAALFITLWLEYVIHRNLWSSWYALLVTFLWMVFLPNTFYMITDFIHVPELPAGSLLHGTFMFASFVFTGVMLGFISTYLVHMELKKRLGMRPASIIIGGVLLICSVAMYVGRELRWNSWDIVTNPASLLFDVTDRLLNVPEHPYMFASISSFFVLIVIIYGVLWWLVRAARNLPADN
ncbi:MAG TPA: DUF1361 domain-containing protein [Candidatus Saccharimonadales bacterium]